MFFGTNEPVTTLPVPGFEQNKRDVVTCQYLDPTRVAVTIFGTAPDPVGIDQSPGGACDRERRTP